MRYGAYTKQAFQMFEHVRELVWSRIKCEPLRNNDSMVELPMGYEILYGISYGKSLAKLGMTAIYDPPAINATTQARLATLLNYALQISVRDNFPVMYLPSIDMFPSPLRSYYDGGTPQAPSIPSTDIPNPVFRQLLVSESYCNSGSTSTSMWKPWKFPGRIISRLQECCARPCVEIADLVNGVKNVVDDCCKSW
jgi:hypothetical protein